MRPIKKLELCFIDTAVGVVQLEHRLNRSHIRFMGYDTEYDPGRPFPDNRGTENIRRRRPLLMSLCVVTSGRGPDCNELTAQGFVLDLRREEVKSELKFLRQTTAKVVGHFLETDLITLLACGTMFEGATYYDTFLAEKYQEMGRGHGDLDRELDRIEAETADPVQAEILCSEFEKDYFDRRYSLLKVAERYNVAHRFANTKQRLQESFIGMPPNRDFTQEQLEYAFEDAFVACGVYLAQYEALVHAGCQTHLEQVEFPLIPHLTKSQWDGAKVDVQKLGPVLDRVAALKAEKKASMKSHYDLDNFRSHNEKKSVVSRLGIDHLVRDRDGQISLGKKKVAELADRHPYFKDHLQLSHLESTGSSIERILDLVDDAGFIHPRFHQLQAKTGRITTTRPSPFDKLLRPIIVPSMQSHGIFALDVGQAEVWIIACMSGDRALQRACDTYDVYLKLGVDLVPGWFQPEDARLIGSNAYTAEEAKTLKYFKEKKYKQLRNTLLKSLILAILYGQKPRTVAKKTKQKLSFIEAVFQKLEITYPDLFKFIRQNIKFGSHRGYIELQGGFRIHVSGAANEVNRLRNNPIQGMCAVLFNRALLQAYEAAPRFGARLLFSLYDAIVWQAPVGQAKACTQAFAQIFSNVFQGAFPGAIAPVKLDASDEDEDHSCWHDGDPDSLLDVPVKRDKKV